MAAERTTPAFEQLLTYLKRNRGFDFTAYKRSTLSRRIDKRLSTIKIDNYDDYVDYLEVHPDEFERLFNTILINVTAFFRDRDMFDYLRDHVIKALLESRPPDQHIRIWSAGCASGEECYSIAMLFAEALGAGLYRERVKIYATDVDEDALGLARQATYTARQLEAVPEDLKLRYFDRNGTGWVFKKEYRRGVIFGRHDLLDDAPISKVDLLVCRNTLMYFNHEAQSKIASRFRFALREGGYLVLGKAEMLVNFNGAFAPADLKRRVFIKLPTENGPERAHAGNSVEPGDRAAQMAGLDRLREISFDQDPVAQLVLNDTNHLVLANTRARDLFGLVPRDMGRSLQDLELSYRPAELRACIDDARVRREMVQLSDVPWPTPSGGERRFNIQVAPMFDASNASMGTRIVFDDITRERELQAEVQRSREDLETANEELQSTNEELETTNEELQSTVEELETTNEELQSTNEELETMNEELQSTNEQLETVNVTLQQRGIDLARTNIFLSGILKNVPLGVAVMNDNLHVELWNDVLTELWGLHQKEVQGRHFFSLDIGLPLEPLRQPMLSLISSPEQAFEVDVDATNRRGRRTKVHILCAGAGGPAEHGRGIILLMQEKETAANPS